LGGFFGRDVAFRGLSAGHPRCEDRLDFLRAHTLAAVELGLGLGDLAQRIGVGEHLDGLLQGFGPPRHVA
jgi:hypothetical protein